MDARLSPRSEEIKISLIDLDIPNDRHETDAGQLKELADSIKVQGLISPVTVYEKKGGRFLLGCGHRRLAAHKLLKLDVVRAEIRAAASTAEILAARAIENLQRSDLTPLEEADACDALLENHDGDAQKAADSIGWPIRRFENRLALARLSPRVRELLDQGKLYLAHAQLIARIPDFKKQEEIAGEMKGDTRKFGGKVTIDEPPGSISRCKILVEGYQRDVSKVVWRTDLPFGGKPACDGCPSRTGNCKGLFAFQEDDNPNICLDAECFQEKSTLASRAVKKVGHTIAKEGLAKSEEGVREAIVIRGPDEKVDYVKPAAAIKASKAVVIAKPSKRNAIAAGKATADEKRGERKRAIEDASQELLDQALEIWKKKLEKAVSDALLTKPLRIAMLATLMLHSKFGDAGWYQARPAARDTIEKLSKLLLMPTVGNLESIVAAVTESSKNADVYDDEMPSSFPFNVINAGFNGQATFNDRHLELLAKALDLDVARKPVLKDFQSVAEKKLADEEVAIAKKAESDARAKAGDKTKAAQKAKQRQKTKPKKK